MSPQCLPPTLGSIWRRSGRAVLDAHLGYQNGTNLAILNHHVLSLPPIKFQLNLTQGTGGDVFPTISRWPTWQPSGILKRNNFQQFWISMSSKCLQTNLGSIWLSVGSRLWFEDFQDGCPVAIYDIWTNHFSNSEFYVAPMPPNKFQFNPTYNSGEKWQTNDGWTMVNRPEHKLAWSSSNWRSSRWLLWQLSWIS